MSNVLPAHVQNLRMLDVVRYEKEKYAIILEPIPQEADVPYLHVCEIIGVATDDRRVTFPGTLLLRDILTIEEVVDVWTARQFVDTYAYSLGEQEREHAAEYLRTLAAGYDQTINL